MDDNNAVNEIKQYIVVQIGNEQYGIDIQYVENIVRMQRITRVPKAQNYFKGVINLRGEVLPVMSVRLKFGLEDDEITGKTRIIILKLDSQSTVGLMVDQVKEVVTLEADQVEKVQGTSDSRSHYLYGVGKHNGELISLLNTVNVIADIDGE